MQNRSPTRGGSAFAPRKHQLVELEEYELADYVGIRIRREKDNRHLKREAKRAEKRRQLDETDEMKFSHSIQFNAVPDWSSHYIAYSNLKKLYVCRGSHSSSLMSDLSQHLPA